MASGGSTSGPAHVLRRLLPAEREVTGLLALMPLVHPRRRPDRPRR
nr:hypothetical protein [Streptomyces pactum]